MCFPTIEGAIEVEERRPRYANEPRRKRLNFVKDRGTRLSDEWVLTSPSTAERFRQYNTREPHQWPQQFRQPQQFNQQLPQRMLPLGYPEHRPLPHSIHNNGVEPVEEYNPGNQMHPQPIGPHHNNIPEIEPRYPEFQPRSQLPPHLQANPAGRGDSRGRSRPRSRQRQDRSVYSDDTRDDSRDRGRRRRSRRTQSRRPRSPSSADSYDSFNLPARQHRRPRSRPRAYY
ncbi:hypothetical protein MMC29_002506 [Sticta canariensis]|nr:hypothetical protein [Sticta canariensis]